MSDGWKEIESDDEENQAEEINDNENLSSFSDVDLELLEDDLKLATFTARHALQRIAVILPRIIGNLESKIAAQEEAKMWPNQLMMMAVQANRLNDVAIKTIIAVQKISGKKTLEGPLIEALKAMEKDGLI